MFSKLRHIYPPTRRNWILADACVYTLLIITILVCTLPPIVSNFNYYRTVPSQFIIFAAVLGSVTIAITVGHFWMKYKFLKGDWEGEMSRIGEEMEMDYESTRVRVGRDGGDKESVEEIVQPVEFV